MLRRHPGFDVLHVLGAPADRIVAACRNQHIVFDADADAVVAHDAVRIDACSLDASCLTCSSVLRVTSAVQKGTRSPLRLA